VTLRIHNNLDYVSQAMSQVQVLGDDVLAPLRRLVD
jgi:hypothetical protein